MFRLRLKIHFILGARPEAIKLAPVIRRLREQPQEFETRVIVTAQHRDLLDQALQAFAISPDYDLDIMRPDQSLLESTSQIMGALSHCFSKKIRICCWFKATPLQPYAEP